MFPLNTEAGEAERADEFDGMQNQGSPERVLVALGGHTLLAEAAGSTSNAAPLPLQGPSSSGDRYGVRSISITDICLGGQARVF